VFYRKSIIIFIAIIIFTSAGVAAKDSRDYSQAAVFFVDSQYAEARGLTLYAQEITDLKIISRQSVYRVSTAQTIPFLAWVVIVDETGKPFSLSWTNLAEFNRFIAKENLNLKSKSDYTAFTRLFLTVASGGEIFLREGELTDPFMVRDEFRNQKIDFTYEIGNDNLVNLKFFSSNTRGSVKFWELKISRLGKIYKIQKKDVTIN
jgi:hypothetical protein